jgi:hypothetical protein
MCMTLFVVSSSSLKFSNLLSFFEYGSQQCFSLRVVIQASAIFVGLLLSVLSFMVSGSHSWCCVFLYVWLSLNMSNSNLLQACPEGTPFGFMNVSCPLLPSELSWSLSLALVTLSHIQGKASAIFRNVKSLCLGLQ